MEKFSRYKDKDGRLLIVTGRWSSWEKGKVIPKTIDILDVQAEKEYSYSVEEFEYWIKKKMIFKINISYT